MNELKPRQGKTPLAGITCVLFDLDGTLIDTVDLIYRSFDHAVKTVLGLSLPKTELLRNLGRPLITQMKLFSAPKADELMDTYNRHNLENHDSNVKAYPHAVETLKWLKREKAVKIGIVTSKKQKLARRGLEITGLLDYVDLVIAVEDTTRHKPDAEPVTTAMHRLEARPQSTLFIGDSPFDMAAGRAAGVNIGAAYWGPFKPKQLRDYRPDINLSDLSELSKWL